MKPEVAWTRDRPSSAGYWWVWSEDFPCCGEVYATLCIKGNSGELVAGVPDMDYYDPITSENWDECLWMGPIEVSPKPEGGKGEAVIYITRTGYMLTWTSPTEGPRTYACTDRQALDALILRLTGRSAGSFPVESRGLPMVPNARIAGPVHVYSDGNVAWDPVNMKHDTSQKGENE